MSSAGGLSVPTGICTGLAVLYSKAANNPFPEGTYPKGKALNFYWENVRFFAPVVGFPHWTTRPTCAGGSAEDTAALNKSDGKTKTCPFLKDGSTDGKDVNEYMGGVREVPNMALAMRDPAKWGNDASDFRIRSISEYGQNSVGFAE